MYLKIFGTSTRYMKNLTKTADIVVIGGGAAGMMAAITAAENGAEVIVLERNGYCGKKINITGKGRCNLTNDSEVVDVVKNIPHGGKFLYSALSSFTPADVIEWFESRGLPLKTERGGRVFPQSDKAIDVSALLRNEMHAAGVKVVQGRADSLIVEDGIIRGVKAENDAYGCKAVILATGGVSYPATGSTGDGYTLARSVGHSITKTKASIVSLTSSEVFCAELSGLGLKNVKVKAVTGRGKTIYDDFGELLFTHFGLSGPTILSASAHLCDFDFKTDSCRIEIDLKPALDEGKLDTRILRDFSEAPNKSLANVMTALVPRAMIPIILQKADIDGTIPVNSVTREQRKTIISVLKCFTVSVSGLRPVTEAVITSGGIALREIDSHSMESKLVKGLYFAGEVIDADAYTGGYNLQIAWATGHLAGERAAWNSL